MKTPITLKKLREDVATLVRKTEERRAAGKTAPKGKTK